MERRKEERASLAESGAANKSASCVVLGVNKAKIAESHHDPLLTPIRWKPHFHSCSDQMYDTIVIIHHMESGMEQICGLERPLNDEISVWKWARWGEWVAASLLNFTRRVSEHRLSRTFSTASSAGAELALGWEVQQPSVEVWYGRMPHSCIFQVVDHYHWIILCNPYAAFTPSAPESHVFSCNSFPGRFCI